MVLMRVLLAMVRLTRRPGLRAGAVAVLMPLTASLHAAEGVNDREAAGVRWPSEAVGASNFENDIIPILTRFGCNSSGCHGKAEGQNGFKLSVFGFDPEADYRAITMAARGRRLYPAAPQRSLLLRKASGDLAHGGGVRIDRERAEYQTLLRWIVAGYPFGSPHDPKIASIKVTPDERQLAMHSQQPLHVEATWSDGSQRDVSRLATYQSNNESLATVDENGLITVGSRAGDVAVMATYLGQVDVFHGFIPRGESLGSFPSLAEANFIDRYVHEKLKRLNIVPSEPADDATFLRRVYLDVIGTAPTADEARRFLGRTHGDHRMLLVDELLKRSEYADYWAMKWSDLLRVNRLELGRKQAFRYYKWIRDSFAANKSLDRFAAELLTAEGPIDEVPAAQFFKVVAQPGQMASTLSQVFLGVRIECAQCHHHPYDRWGQDEFYGMQAFFTQVSFKPSPLGEMILSDGNAKTVHPRSGEEVWARALGEPAPREPYAGNRRGRLAGWMTARDNPWFARNMANRIWAHFMGRGLVDPVDDVRLTNPPSHPELLDALAQYLVEHDFDQQSLIRLIVASQTYQRSSRPNETNQGDEQNYSRFLLKRVEAEVLFDAVCQATGVGEKFSGVPAGSRAIQLWDSHVPHYFLQLFGRPERATACECERVAEPTVAQVLHVLNSPEIQAKLSHASGRVARLVESEPSNDALIDELYLNFFSRPADDEERRVPLEYLQANPDRQRAAEDLAWSLLNSLEFLFNH
jgi:hypothetical protein